MSYLFVGLGNPGDKYKHNRHNIGFMVIDYILSELSNVSNISKNKFMGELSKSGNDFFLKPTTYMNNSGQSVQSVVNYYDIDDVIVIHDDLDLDFGAIRFKHGGGSGGHNGLKSIDQYISNQYSRIRIGISKPAHGNVANYVLKDFAKAEMICIDKIKEYIFRLLLDIKTKEISLISSKYTQKNICNETF